MNNAEWLEERRKGIGGSDIAAIMGLSPWRSAYQVYLEKRKEVDDWAGNEASDWGKRMEPALRQWYSDTTGRAVRLPEKIMYHSKYPFMLASLDGFTDDRRIVEIKTARNGKGWGEPGTNEIPDYYALQAHHYMAVTGFEVADVPVSIAGGPPVLYEVPADMEIQEMIIDVCASFWLRVKEGTPPPPVTYSDAIQRFGQSASTGTVVATEGIIRDAIDLRAVRLSMKELEAMEEEIKGRLIIAIGDGGDALVDPEGNQIATYRMAKSREYLDVALLKKEMPGIYAKYLKTSEPTRRFLLKGV